MLTELAPFNLLAPQCLTQLSLPRMPDMLITGFIFKMGGKRFRVGDIVSARVKVNGCEVFRMGGEGLRLLNDLAGRERRRSMFWIDLTEAPTAKLRHIWPRFGLTLLEYGSYIELELGDKIQAPTLKTWAMWYPTRAAAA